MVEKLAVNLVGQMVEQQMIEVQQKDEYVYSFVMLIEKMIIVGTILAISLFMGNFIPTIFFLVFFLSLRSRTGGFHCNTFFQCYIWTTFTYVLIVVLAELHMYYLRVLPGILILAIIVILIIGTVNHPNMNMDASELAGSKKAARMLVILQGGVIGFFTFIKAEAQCICYMSVAVILCAMLLCLSKLLKQEVKNGANG